MGEGLKIAKLDVYAYRAAISAPVVTSFSTMPSRAAAILRIEDADGAWGWGEIWGNFPIITTEYRAALAGWALPPHLIGAAVDAPGPFCERLAEKLHVLKIQSAETGPVESIIAATNQSLWDLVARKRGEPLRRVLNPDARDTVPAYASGLNPGDCVATVERARAEGFRAFKLKIGFGDDVDRRNLRAIRAGMTGGERLFVDANQRWTLDEVRSRLPFLEEMSVGWLEEPMPADSPVGHWRVLARETGLPLAGGENLRGAAAFDACLEWLSFVQPDVGKWGGVDGCLAIARRAVAAGRAYCPHWLSGGVGLMHSANLLAAAGGGGLLEVDANENPLRTRLIEGVPGMRDAAFHMSDAPGIGIEPPIADMTPWLVSHEHYPRGDA